MDAISFKESLTKTKPSVNDLIAAGLSETEASQFAGTYDVNDRLEARPSEIPDTVLQELFSRFDPSQVEIGMVRLLKHPDLTKFGWVFAMVESDPIVIDPHSGEIVSIDHDTPDHVVWRCAKDGESFLSALTVSAEYLSGAIVKHDCDINYQNSTLAICSELSGGDCYLDFYKMLLGIERLF